MRFSAALAVLPALAASVSAQTNFQVQVGANGTLTYSPNTITAAVGDTISFLFMAKNHTVTQSTFPSPCESMAGGIDSGFQPVAAGATSVPSWTITVNATTPLWFYCKQTGHCEKGMVLAVNPTANKTFEAFQAAANSSDATTGAPASSAASPSSSSTASGSGSAPSASTTAAANGAVARGVGAGSALAALGLAAGLLL
ncbi:hypothetical protein BV25DRAFT_236948 [Artomyces pyxidatus]|uniref:Uncharacterized protein n=2 Tax=Artomyces pyxidatus TaxID=48021 RepID=A0ACB8SJB1_9AGAM|nr:hypothetical protein BV25DRAFT_1578083 [Artomyces pyxidatus]KAI0064434.1 hypothetical protein BV25DRAFT_236948 [Artomyces pyxidatus]